jgi:hypothetical protein
MVEMIAVENNVMEKLKVVHGATKIKLIVKDHALEIGV